MEQKLWDAAENGREEEARNILSENKDINVNWANSSGYAALHGASRKGFDKIVALLLAHPDIDVNVQTNKGSSPFLLAC
jgi:ankyrin repeat protein